MTDQLLSKGILLKNIVTIPNWATGDLTVERDTKNKLKNNGE